MLRASSKKAPAARDYSEYKIKLVEIVDDEEKAKLISDPMRRAILNLLRKRALTEAELAESLGLTDATVNYHLNLLRRSGFLSVVKRELEEHGIMQKFYAPSAFLYIPDIESLPREVARYYYPINIERMRGTLGALGLGRSQRNRRGDDIDKLGEDLAKALVKVAKEYSGREVHQGEGEPQAHSIYLEALSVIRNPG